MSREGGYTLLELLIVMVLLGSLFALLLPGVTRLYGQYDLDAAARTIISDVRSDQTAAMSREQVREIVFDRFTPGYFQKQDGKFRERVVLSPSLRYRNGYIEQWIAILRLDPSGITNGSGSIRLVNGARQSADVTLQVTYGNIIYEGVKPR